MYQNKFHGAKLYTKEVEVSNLKVGDVLTHDVYLRNGVLVAKGGMELTAKQIEKLKQIETKIVTVDLQNLYLKGISATKTIMETAAEGKSIKKQDVSKLLDPFIQEVKREKNITKLLTVLQAKDDYTYQHTIHIGLLSMTIGGWLGLEGKELHDLMLAGTLHDIGKSLIPLDILTKPGPLNAAEFEIMKQHPGLGYDILNRSGDYEESLKFGVLQHHERINGSGYPNHLTGKEIHLFARIIAIADVYHALTSDRVYKKKLNSYTALEHLYRNKDAFDSEIVFLFIDKMLACLQSCSLVLSNGMLGDVILINNEYIASPLIKIKDKGEFIDLKVRRDVSICDIIY